jgi:hypothetical protein
LCIGSWKTNACRQEGERALLTNHSTAIRSEKFSSTEKMQTNPIRKQERNRTLIFLLISLTLKNNERKNRGRSWRVIRHANDFPRQLSLAMSMRRFAFLATSLPELITRYATNAPAARGPSIVELNQTTAGS